MTFAHLARLERVMRPFVVGALLFGCGAGPADDDGIDESALRRKSSTASAQKPTYADLEKLEGAALKRALAAFVGGHRSLGYDRARDALLNDAAFTEADGTLECVYTGRRVAPDGTRSPGRTFNTEHTWPQSLGAMHEPARSDLHHLFPVDERANSARNNHLYGTPRCRTTDRACSFAAGGSALGEDVHDELVFEVRRARRGDVARAHFYFAIRYNEAIGAEEEAVLRAWHHEDPVDARERARDAAIAALQGNENPFVAHPELVSAVGDF